MILFSTRSHARRNAGAMLLATTAALTAPLAPAAAAAITGVAVSDSAITLSFDDMIADAHAFLLAAPYRIAVDLAGIDGGHADATGGSVVRTRIGLPHDGRTRVVFDLAGPIRLRSATLAALDAGSLRAYLHADGSPCTTAFVDHTRLLHG